MLVNHENLLDVWRDIQQRTQEQALNPLVTRPSPSSKPWRGASGAKLFWLFFDSSPETKQLFPASLETANQNKCIKGQLYTHQ